MAMADTTNSRIIASATVTGRQSVFVRNDSIIKMARVAIGQLSHIQSKLDLFTSRIIDVFAVQSHSGPNMEQWAEWEMIIIIAISNSASNRKPQKRFICSLALPLRT